MDLAWLLLTSHLGLAAIGSPPLSLETAAPLLAPEAPLTLAAAVAQARTASPRRRAAVYTAEGVHEAARLSGRVPNPLFEVRTENWSFSGHPTSPGIDVFAVFTQPIELGGKRDLRRQLASTESALAETALHALERELALDVVRGYIRALKARALVETLTGNRDGLAMIVASVDRRVDEGYSPEADLLRFKTEAARVDGDIARARVELERSLAALTVVIGAATLIRSDQLVEPSAVEIPAADPATLAQVIAEHPDVLHATALVQRSRQVMVAERARQTPDALVTGGYKRTGGYDTLVLGAAVALPFFERNDAAVARSVGAERAAAADRDALVQQLTHEAGALFRAAEAMTAQANRAPRELLAPAEAVRRAALAAFREGAADVMKLIDAERVYAEVHRAAIELRLDALQTTIEARFALGEEAVP